MKKSRYLSLVVVLLVSLLPLVGPPPPGAAQAPAALEPELLSTLQAEGSANYFVKMTIEADLSPAEGMDWDARGEFVWNALNEVARTTQAPVLDYCHKNGLDCTSMIASNSVFVRAGNMTAAQVLATLPGVATLRLERILPLPDPVAGGTDGSGAMSQGAAPEATTAWGIIDTKANQVWALGYKGAGIKVAGIDTGVQWNHPALVGHFACPGQPGNAACWYDPSNICGGSACDNNGHGTHTMGTMVADDNPALTYIAGMAPDATWIACKGCEDNSCSDFALSSCADWILAPGGDPANRPHIVNNSWGGSGGNNWYLTYVQAWRAAGIFPAFSAGNEGEFGCFTLGSPGDYQASMASAAHDSGRSNAWFSSRGPSTYGHAPYTKPNISAPGVATCSTVPTNSWACDYNGTSMASPHTAGAVALIWQACPALKGNMTATFELLQDNADTPPAGPCLAPPDGEGNYTYGYGYLNALRAVQACAGPTITSITPNHGEQGSAVSITNLAGTKFQTGATVKLTKSGKPDINGTSVNVVSETQITCQFDLAGAAIGAWSVVVTNPDTKSGRLANGFVVTGGTPTYLPLVSQRWPPIPDPPTLNPISNPDGDGKYTVSWSAPAGATGYTLQEDDNASFSSPATAYSGPATSRAFTGKPAGTYYYRVNASNAYGPSDWSNTRSVAVSGWITIKSETFEGTFPGDWDVADAEPSNGQYHWGKRNCRAYEGSYSGWAVGGGDGTGLSCGSSYPIYTTAWMVYGPFSLAGASGADLTYQLWLNTEVDYDYVFRGASVDGSNFHGYITTGDTGGWLARGLDLTAVPDLGNLTGESNVWIAVLFLSDYLVTRPEGAHVDNIVLRKSVGTVAASMEEGLPPLPSTAREEVATFTR